jgi:hypothetical protein
MTERPSNRPGKSEPWPTMHRKLTMQLEPSDRIFFRSVNARGIPAGVGAGNAGKACTVIIGHNEIEDLEKVRTFRDLEEFRGSSVVLDPEDIVFSSQIDRAGAPFSVGASNKGKDVTIILYSEPQEEAEKSTGNEDKLPKLKAEFMKTHEQLNRLAEQINALEKIDNASKMAKYGGPYEDEA